MNIEMILSDQHKKENEDIIKELKIQNTFIENKLQQISIFYITNKDKYNYELAKTFLDNLYNFIEETNSQLIKSNNYNLYLEMIKAINDMPNDNNIKSWKQSANKLFYSFCNEEQDKLINLMHINERKLKIYENLLELYLNNENENENENENDNDDDDELEIKIKPEYNMSIITNIIFLIMILFIIIVIMVTVFMIDQYHLPYNYNNEQCSKFFNKQSKLI